MKHRIKKVFDSLPITPDTAPVEELPRITNETISEHREAVIGRARKYISPFQHSKHKIVLISSSILIALFVGLFVYCTVALYRLHDSSSFIYKVTQVIPFPLARTGSNFIAYENYLFEVRHYTHYYSTQQGLDFKSTSGKQQLADFRKRALEKVIDDSYIKRIAAQKRISVSDKEIDEQISIIRKQNRLGGSDKVFEDVLKDYYGWNLDDFKRSLRLELLSQKVSSALDTGTTTRAQSALAELKAGADFVATAKKYSDDQSKANGGEYGYPIDKTTRSVNPQAIEALYKLKPGQYSEVTNTGSSLEIFKVIDTNGDKIRAAHIVFNFKDLNIYLNDLKEKDKTQSFVKF